MNFYSQVKKCFYGNCLVATRSLLSMTVVEKFKGKISSLDKIPEVFKN